MNDCIIWPGAKNEKGYGLVSINGKTRRAHRVSLEIKTGRRLVGKEIAMHLCDNPPCINPKHLKIGTAKENKAMSLRKYSLADKLLSGWRAIYKK